MDVTPTEDGYYGDILLFFTINHDIRVYRSVWLRGDPRSTKSRSERDERTDAMSGIVKSSPSPSEGLSVVSLESLR